MSTQYDLDTIILPIIVTEELPILKEIENKKIFTDQECQTITNIIIHSDEYTQTSHIYLNDCASQSIILTYENQDIQTEPYSNLYSSSLYIVPTSPNESYYSSTVLIMPKEYQPSPIVIDQEIQCDLYPSETSIPIEVECKTTNNDRRSIIQQQMDQKEKQMNRIIGRFFLI